MKISLIEQLAKLPLPATNKWPHGVWDIEAFKHGTLSVILYTPKFEDLQSPHDQDELYVVLSGSGEMVMDTNVSPSILAMRFLSRHMSCIGLKISAMIW